MSSSTLDIQRHGAVALLRLSRPEQLNALSLEMKDELAVALSSLLGDHAVRALVLTGAGRAFCAGADLTDLAPESGVAFADRLRKLQRSLIEQLACAEIPVIGAINGPAVGGGFAIATACDVLLAAPEAYFLAPQVGLGLAPDLGLVATLAARIGGARTRALLLTASRLSADEAKDWGLVHKIVPGSDLVDAAMALATEMAARPAAGVAATKRLLDALDSTDRRTILRLEAAELALLRLTEEHGEVVAAFRS
jgi:enoyl-CoA hydratase/carnithine racemase